MILALYIAALVCLLLAAVGIKARNVNLLALGMALWILVPIARSLGM